MQLNINKKNLNTKGNLNMIFGNNKHAHLLGTQIQSLDLRNSYYQTKWKVSKANSWAICISCPKVQQDIKLHGAKLKSPMQENSFLFLIVFLQNMSSLLDMIEDELQSFGELSLPRTIVGESSKTKVDDVKEHKLG